MLCSFLFGNRSTLSRRTPPTFARRSIPLITLRSSAMADLPGSAYGENNIYIYIPPQKKSARNDADVTINELYFHESWATRVKLEWKERDGNGTALNPLKGEEVAGAVPSQLST